MPKIAFNLNLSEIDRAIRDVKAYADSIDRKTVKVREEVCVKLEQSVKDGFNGASTGDVLRKEGKKLVFEGQEVPDVEVSKKLDDGKNSFVYANGKSAVFQEFGAGVYYNPPVGGFPHPNTPPGISAIGTYGKGYGARKVWAYPDGSGGYKLTHGTPASKPMYNAVQEIIPMIPEIARKVFKDGGNG